MATIFISYSSENTEIAQQYKTLLDDESIEAFLACTSIKAGKDFDDVVKENIRDAQCLILLASKDSIKSVFVNQEIGYFHFTEKPIIPVLLDIGFSELPGWAKKYQGIDCRDNSKEGKRKLLSAIEEYKREFPTLAVALSTLALAIVGGIAIHNNSKKKQNETVLSE